MSRLEVIISFGQPKHKRSTPVMLFVCKKKAGMKSFSHAISPEIQSKLSLATEILQWLARVYEKSMTKIDKYTSAHPGSFFDKKGIFY